MATTAATAATQAPPREIRFVVYGEPKPQGSQQHRFVPSLGHTVAHEKHSLLDWRKQVAHVAGQNSGGEIFEGPVEVECTFFRLRPKSASKRVLFPATAPDVDKLCRGILDALQSVLIRNDSQVVDLHARKRFGAVAGCEIVVRAVA